MKKTTTKETYLYVDLSSEHFQVITYVDLLCTNNYNYVFRSVHAKVNIYVYKRVCKYACINEYIYMQVCKKVIHLDMGFEDA